VIQKFDLSFLKGEKKSPNSKGQRCFASRERSPRNLLLFIASRTGGNYDEKSLFFFWNLL
jgi:hypothetical protein